MFIERTMTVHTQLHMTAGWHKVRAEQYFRVNAKLKGLWGRFYLDRGKG